MEPYLNLINTLVICSTAVFAWIGLNTWASELRGKREYNAAFNIIKSTLRLRNAIQLVRNPLIVAGEKTNALNEKIKENPEFKEQLKSQQAFDFLSTSTVYEKRWMIATDALNDFDIAVLDAEVLWGNQVTEITFPLRKILGTLNFAINDHLEMIRPGNDSFEDKETRKIRRDTLYKLQKESEFDLSLDIAVEKIRERFSKSLERKDRSIKNEITKGLNRILPFR